MNGCRIEERQYMPRQPRMWDVGVWSGVPCSGATVWKETGARGRGSGWGVEEKGERAAGGCFSGGRGAGHGWHQGKCEANRPGLRRGCGQPQVANPPVRQLALRCMCVASRWQGPRGGAGQQGRNEHMCTPPPPPVVRHCPSLPLFLLLEPPPATPCHPPTSARLMSAMPAGWKLGRPSASPAVKRQMPTTSIRPAPYWDALYLLYRGRQGRCRCQHMDGCTRKTTSMRAPPT